MIEGLSLGQPAFLASVTSAGEAESALSGGADIIDCKDPKSGALGALGVDVVREIVSVVSGRAAVSATVGDLPADADILSEASVRMAATGIDIVKIGFFGDGDPSAAIARLGTLDLGDARLVAVLMADEEPDFALVPKLAAAGFAGVMLDTANKSAGRLVSVISTERLTEFLRLARENRLFVGLAGSLKEGDIARLARLGPDMLGFRGALCSAGRTSGIERDRVAAVRHALDAVEFEKTRETRVV